MILFEDDHVLAVDKPEGLAAIPERAPCAPSLLGLLSQGREERLFVVHRLDKEVSGVILFAKTVEAHRFLNDQFSSHRVGKQYAALVHGVPSDRGTIRHPVREFGSGRMGVDPRGKRAQTSFEVMARLPHLALLRVVPKTGRRHQIRVHLFSIGHPVVGDSRYGSRQLQDGFARLMLHATSVRFVSLAGQTVIVESPPSQSFSLELDRLRAGIQLGDDAS